MNPTADLPIIYDKALGLNDAYGELKIQRGFSPFEINLHATGDIWDRRQGRDFFLLQSGLVTMIFQLSWDDGTRTDIAAIGSSLYDLTETFTYLVSSGIRLVIQSPDLNYWNVTPNDTTGLINPTVVAAPAAAAQVANFTVLNGESFGFVNTSGTVVRLNADEDHNGWYLQSLGATTSLSTISTDMVFTVASGFSFRIKDYLGNNFKLTVTNDGALTPITV